MALKNEIFDGKILFDCSIQIEKYKCKMCPNFQTNFLTSLKHHPQDDHETDESDNDFYKCLKCFFVTHLKYLMERHSLFSECATSNKNERTKRFRYYSNGQSEFSFCLNEESGPAFHEEINGFECERYPPKLKTKDILKKQSKPKVIRWYGCPQCSYKGKKRCHLKRHIKFIHFEGIQWFQCEHCPTKFKRQYSLTNHVIAWHSKPEDIQWLQCEHCQSKFKTKDQLKKHTAARHTKPENIRWFECGQCSSKLKSKTTLRKHINALHQRPEAAQWYNCPHCSYKCKDNSNMIRHIKLRYCKPGDVRRLQSERHASKAENDASLKKQVVTNDAQPDIAWFKCEQCSYKCKQRHSLKRHAKARHCQPEDIVWFKCEHCSSKYKTKHLWEKHVKRHAAMVQHCS